VTWPVPVDLLVFSLTTDGRWFSGVPGQAALPGRIGSNRTYSVFLARHGQWIVRFLLIGGFLREFQEKILDFSGDAGHYRARPHSVCNRLLDRLVAVLRQVG
jgi:hypothetical protein